MFNTEERPRFNLYQKKLMKQPDPLEDVVAQPKVEATSVQSPTEDVVDVKATPTKKEVDTNSYLGGMFENRPSSPKYNTTAEQQDKAMMNAQAIGNLLALVGDVGGVALGANVARRESKPLEPYMQSIQKRKEKFEKDKQIFDKEDWLFNYNELLRKERGDIAAEEKDYRRGQDVAKASIEAEERDWDKYEFLEKQGNIEDANKLKADIEANKLKAKAKKDSDKAKDIDYAFEVGVGNESIGITESEMRDILMEGKGAFDEVLTGQKGEAEAFEKIREKLKEPAYKAWFLQKNKKGGIKSLKEFKKTIPVGPENWTPSRKSSTSSVPSMFK